MISVCFNLSLIPVTLSGHALKTCWHNPSSEVLKFEMELLTTRLSKISECKDEEGSHEICVKVVKELGFGVCHTGIDQLKAKLERSCAQTCHYCK